VSCGCFAFQSSGRLQACLTRRKECSPLLNSVMVDALGAATARFAKHRPWPTRRRQNGLAERASNHIVSILGWAIVFASSVSVAWAMDVGVSGAFSSDERGVSAIPAVSLCGPDGPPCYDPRLNWRCEHLDAGIDAQCYAELEPTLPQALVPE